MKLPEKVRVAGIDWDIQIDEIALAEERNYAQTLYKEHRILMSERWPLSKTKVTLIHELIHVALANLTGEDDLSEMQVSVISSGLHEAIFVDNPDVLAFLSQPPAPEAEEAPWES